MPNWYAVQVRVGQEEKVCTLCKHFIGQEITCFYFIPKYERKLKRKGTWKLVQKILFPGYVFMITEQIEQLYYKLKQVPEFTRVLGDQTSFIPLYQNEIKFLQKFYHENQVLEFSYGHIEGQTVIVTEGVLRGMEGNIKKINRHKRIAELELEFFGQITKVIVGLEIISKC